MVAASTDEHLFFFFYYSIQQSVQNIWHQLNLNRTNLRDDVINNVSRTKLD